MNPYTHPVYPIPPSFIEDELELTRTKKYLHFLQENGAKRVMTTAGTSQFNLLTPDEIFVLNKSVINNFKFEKIIGLSSQSYKNIEIQLGRLNKLNADRTSILIIFPERYYNDQQVVHYVEKVCRYSNYPVYLHGNPLRKGNGGIYEYTATLLNKLSKIDNFVGIKEEYSSIDLAFKTLPDVKNLDIIVAGGSMRRFWALSNYGATSFLTGIGSFNPKHSEYFFDNFVTGSLDRCTDVIEHLEKPFFQTCMKIGWHASMRTGLQKLTFILENRQPFVELDPTDKNDILNAVNLIRI